MLARSASKGCIPTLEARRGVLHGFLSIAMWMHGRFRADSPQGVGCETFARFHDPATLTNALVGICALPDPLRGIGSVSLALTTRILEKPSMFLRDTPVFQDTHGVAYPQSRHGVEFCAGSNKNVSNHPARSIVRVEALAIGRYATGTGGRFPVYSKQRLRSPTRLCHARFAAE